MILVVCAVARELATFAPRTGVEVFACGVGPVEAAAATARKLASGAYACAINAGIAGVFRGRGGVGDAFVVVTESLAGLGIEGGIALTLPDGVTLVTEERADHALAARIRESLAVSDGAPHIRIGRGLTVAEVTSTDATAAKHAARYGADVESMEGFAVLRAAALAGVPALELRGISNIVGDRTRAEWNFGRGARAAVRALDAALDALGDGTFA